MRTSPLELVTELNQRVLEAPRLQDALDTVASAALRLLPGDHASLRLCEANGSLRPAARAGVGLSRPAPSFRLGEGVMGWVAQTGLVARVRDSLHEPRFRQVEERGFDVSSILSAPIGYGGRVLGVLSVSAGERGAFRKRDETVALLLSAVAAQALRVSELKQMAMTDPQTSALNRRCLLPRLSQEMRRAVDKRQPLSLLLIDLDHFKRVNDQHGHAAGDVVLRACADRIRDCVRDSDVLVRRGGEEFVLIMPATDLEPARAVAERVRRHLGGRPLSIGGPSAAPLPGVARTQLIQTASIGVALWDREESAESLEERADAAMYAAKRGGRDRVVA